MAVLIAGGAGGDVLMKGEHWKQKPFHSTSGHALFTLTKYGQIPTHIIVYFIALPPIVK